MKLGNLFFTKAAKSKFFFRTNAFNAKKQHDNTVTPRGFKLAIPVITKTSQTIERATLTLITLSQLPIIREAVFIWYCLVFKTRDKFGDPNAITSYNYQDKFHTQSHLRLFVEAWLRLCGKGSYVLGMRRERLPNRGQRTL